MKTKELLKPCHGIDCPLVRSCKRALIGIVMGSKAEKENYKYDDEIGCTEFVEARER